VYYTGAKDNIGEAEHSCANKVLDTSNMLKFKPFHPFCPNDKYIAVLNVVEKLEEGAGKSGDELLNVRKQCLVNRDGALASASLIKGEEVVLSNKLSMGDVCVVVNVSKKALLTLQQGQQVNSEIIDAAMYLAVANAMEGTGTDIRYLPATLLPSTPSSALVFRSWRWVPQYLASGRRFLFLLHEEHIPGCAGHYNFLYVEVPREVGKSGKLHIFDPNLTNPLNARERLGELSHVVKWVSRFFVMYGVQTQECEFEVKMALPMSHRLHHPLRESLPSDVTHISSRFSMRTQDDGSGCGVACAQVMECWIRTKIPPKDAKFVPHSSSEYRDVLLNLLCDGLKFAIPPFDEGL
jgi:hypothetical protein